MLVFNQVYHQNIANLSFMIKRGEFVYLYHPEQGLLDSIQKLICLEKKPEHGLVNWLNRKDLSSQSLKEDLGLVYPEDILLPKRTLLENFCFIMEARGLERGFFKTRIKRVINLSGLDRYCQNRPGELPLYILKRANIAAALLHYPSTLLLIDPTSEIDQVNSQAIIRLLRAINQDKITVIMLSSDHNLVLGKQPRKIKLTADRTGTQKEGYYA